MHLRYYLKGTNEKKLGKRRSLTPFICCLMGLMLLAMGGMAWAESVQKIRNKYKNAKALQKSQKYEKAIREFNEIKVLQYHPILDYRLGQCYESLKQYKAALASYELYVKYYNKFQPGKNHPTPKEAKKRVDAVRRLAADEPGITPPPSPGHPIEGEQTGDTEDGGSGHTERRPHPGAGSQGGYSFPEPPPRDIKPSKMFPRWRAMYFGADLGLSNSSTGDFSSEIDRGFGFSAWAFYRPFYYLSVGLTGSINSFTRTNTNNIEQNPVLGTFCLEARGHLPIMSFQKQNNRFEFWGGFFVGYAGFELKGKLTLNSVSSEFTYKAQGAALGAGLGIEWYTTRWLSFGFVARLTKPFLKTTDELGIGDSVFQTGFSNALGFSPGEGPDLGVIWYVGFSTTFHLYFDKVE